MLNMCHDQTVRVPGEWKGQFTVREEQDLTPTLTDGRLIPSSDDLAGVIPAGRVGLSGPELRAGSPGIGTVRQWTDTHPRSGDTTAVRTVTKLPLLSQTV